MTDIFDEIGTIPDVAAFLDEPTPLKDVPIEQRVQTFLSGLFGAGWASAAVFTWSLPSGNLVYIAFGPPLGVGNFAIQIVAERADGTLALAAPLPATGGEEADNGALVLPDRSQLAQSEQQCLDDILPALKVASGIVAASKRVRARTRKYLCEQIEHAMKHLEMNLEAMRREFDA